MSKRKTTAEFITQATTLHSGKYKYTNVKYIGRHAKIGILCDKHGEFIQTPANHLKGQGCPKCKSIATGNRLRKSLKDFINEARTVHSHKYDYSNVVFKTNKDNISIICPEHGKFKQMVVHHLAGSGCQACSQNIFNKTKAATLYTFKINNVYKVGITGRLLNERYNAADRLLITELSYIHFTSGEDAWKQEKELKEKYKNYRYHGTSPFTDGTSITECFTIPIVI